MTSSLTPAAQVIIAIVPVCGIFFCALVVFFAMLWKHREKSFLIKQGKVTPGVFKFKAFFLLSGLCLLGVGTVMTVMFALISGLSWSLLGGLIPLSLGIMFLVFYRINPDF